MATTPTDPQTTTTHVTGRRVVATLVDGLLFGLAYVALAVVAGTIVPTGPWSWRADMPVAANVAYGVAVVGYYVLMEGLLGQTVGKLVCDIRVIDGSNGALPGLGKAAVRTVLRLVDGLFNYLVAFVAVLTSRNRRRLGDMAAGTLVVRTPR
ncbi:RDD family protein [Actinomycetospora cinnamomea]|uniref:Putative RDD family membrane protein YckC n=1 Tax=Actinomycetospora cinnamomea TaxID=663609 RepID=A0A2U1F2B4_9PSEU|nr:RDD family protein [Actinomycetospora cinnamomea]PVZ06317.1 putative RDD family membrane protein YckC [Actinomycetospora cinnamomea]